MNTYKPKGRKGAAKDPDSKTSRAARALAPIHTLISGLMAEIGEPVEKKMRELYPSVNVPDLGACSLSLAVKLDFGSQLLYGTEDRPINPIVQMGGPADMACSVGMWHTLQRSASTGLDVSEFGFWLKGFVEGLMEKMGYYLTPRELICLMLCVVTTPLIGGQEARPNERSKDLFGCIVGNPKIMKTLLGYQRRKVNPATGKMFSLDDLAASIRAEGFSTTVGALQLIVGSKNRWNDLVPFIEIYAWATGAGVSSEAALPYYDAMYDICRSRKMVPMLYGGQFANLDNARKALQVYREFSSGSMMPERQPRKRRDDKKEKEKDPSDEEPDLVARQQRAVKELTKAVIQTGRKDIANALAGMPADAKEGEDEERPPQREARKEEKKPSALEAKLMADAASAKEALAKEKAMRKDAEANMRDVLARLADMERMMKAGKMAKEAVREVKRKEEIEVVVSDETGEEEPKPSPKRSMSRSPARGASSNSSSSSGTSSSASSSSESLKPAKIDGELYKGLLFISEPENWKIGDKTSVKLDPSVGIPVKDPDGKFWVTRTRQGFAVAPKRE